MKETISKVADFTIRAIILFTTVVALYYFASVYNQIVFTGLVFLFLIALIVQGLADIFGSKYETTY